MSSKTFASRKLLTGWRSASLMATFVVLVSLAVNISTAVWIDIVLIDLVNQYNIWAHVGINIISTLILSGSNYTMQCLAAPTRSDVDQAHNSGIWVDIGVPSLRNLSHIPKWKKILWWMLALSSLPIYLLYNSVIFMSLSSNDYNIYIATDQFVQTAGVSLPDDVHVIDITLREIPLDYEVSYYSPNKENMTAHVREIKNRISSFERLENAQCMRAYKQDFLNDRRTLILVSDAPGLNSTLLLGLQYLTSDAVDAGYNVYLPYEWICHGADRESGTDCWELIDDLITAASDRWTVYGYPVQYCLSETTKQACTLNASLPIVIAVAGCNAFKLVIMAWVAIALRHAPIVTVGDAIASFLHKPDASTANMCLLSRAEIVSGRVWPRPITQPEQGTHHTVLTAKSTKQFWFNAAGVARVVWMLVTLVGLIIVAGSLLGTAVLAIESGSSRAPFSFGFGKVNGIALATGGTAKGGPTSLVETNDSTTRILGTVILANLPQLVFSLNYFLMNAWITTIYLAKEWNGYSIRRKPLRVSSPEGLQRSTYFLSLPYHAAVPLIIGSGMMHWLISQSVFLAVVAGYSPYGDLSDPTQISTLGFSPLPMVIAVVLGILFLIAMLVLGFRRFTSTMPVAGSCSAAIAAACHGPGDDPDISLKPLIWGALPQPDEDQTTVHHCCFTSGAVEAVQEGRIYEGRS